LSHPIPRPRFNVCVFCGAGEGTDAAHREAAKALGAALPARGMGLVYGGAAVGMMGTVADACLEAGGHVEGVLPEGLFTREVAHSGLQRLFQVESMHARKALMAGRSDAFVALPGGFGTLEELFEVITWAQLGIHAKPIALLNVNGYFDRLLEFLDACREEGFIRPADRRRLLSFSSIDPLLDSLTTWRPEKPVVQWLRGNEV